MDAKALAQLLLVLAALLSAIGNGVQLQSAGTAEVDGAARRVDLRAGFFEVAAGLQQENDGLERRIAALEFALEACTK